MLSTKLQSLEEQLKTEKVLGLKYKAKLKKKIEFVKKLTKKLSHYKSPYLIDPENTIKELENEASSNEEEDNSSDNGLPNPLEMLSQEVNKIVYSKKMLKKTEGGLLGESIPGGHKTRAMSNSFKISQPMSKAVEDAEIEPEASSSSGGVVGGSQIFRGRAESMGVPAVLHMESSKMLWTPNDASADCQICKRSFTWYRWRHHCRNCGKLVCHECSSHLECVIGYGDAKVRLCRKCKSENDRRMAATMVMREGESVNRASQSKQ